MEKGNEMFYQPTAEQYYRVHSAKKVGGGGSGKRRQRSGSFVQAAAKSLLLS